MCIPRRPLIFAKLRRAPMQARNYHLPDKAIGIPSSWINNNSQVRAATCTKHDIQNIANYRNWFVTFVVPTSMPKVQSNPRRTGPINRRGKIREGEISRTNWSFPEIQERARARSAGNVKRETPRGTRRRPHLSATTILWLRRNTQTRLLQHAVIRRNPANGNAKRVRRGVARIIATVTRNERAGINDRSRLPSRMTYNSHWL